MCLNLNIKVNFGHIRTRQAVKMYKSRGINHNFFAIKTRPQRFAAPLSLAMARESATVWCRTPAVSVVFTPSHDI